jgi:hypothetical protein
MIEYKNTENVAAGVLSHQITHNLGSINAKIVSAVPKWPWVPKIGISSRTINTITLRFNTDVPAGGSQLDVRIVL